jgi:N-acetylglutamate synthase-like GNAT family acetyltransferase
MRIRKFRKEDAEQVSKIMKRNFLEVNSKVYSKDTIDALLKDSTPKRMVEKSKKRHYYVAVEKDEILGIGGYEGNGKNEIHTFFVNPDVHGKGVGKKLMQRVLKDAKREGIKVMNCASTHYAEKFYESFGFKSFGEKMVPFYNAALPFIQMRKRM